MRAIVVTQLGGPEFLKEQEMPMPSPDGQNDLLVQVGASGLNPIDYKIRRGAFAKDREMPFILGYDVSGVVRGMGRSVVGFSPGQEIYASPSLKRNGANAEYVCVDARTAAPKPRTLGHVDAAALPLVTLTAWEALVLRARIQSGEIVLIHGGAGGVGHIAIQLAKLHGARVLTTASRPESIELCQRLGADVVINHQKEDFVGVVERETRGLGCPVIFDTVGHEVFTRSLDCLAVNGRLITCVGTPSDKIPQKLFRINATLLFEFMGAPTFYGVRPEMQGEILLAASQLVESGKLKPHVSRVLSLGQVAEGHRLLEAGHVTGKLVVEF
jgi:NADPH2:quinone reductase